MLTFQTLTTIFGVLGFLNGHSNTDTLNHSHANSKVNPNVINVSATWGKEPSSVNELKDMSDLVVIGKVGGKRDYITPYSFDENEVFTNVDFKPFITIKGEELKKIDVAFYGGITKSAKKVVWENILPLEESKYYLLFLRKNEDTESPLYGKYTSVAGPAGAYSVNLKGKSKFNSLEEVIEVRKLSEIELSVQEYVASIQNKVMNATIDDLISQ